MLVCIIRACLLVAVWLSCVGFVMPANITRTALSPLAHQKRASTARHMGGTKMKREQEAREELSKGFEAVKRVCTLGYMRMCVLVCEMIRIYSLPLHTHAHTGPRSSRVVHGD
jgi:hypothetical protein